MKNYWRVLLTAFLLLVLCGPAWANGHSKKKLPWLSKNHTHYGHYHTKHRKVDKHKLKVLKEFRLLKAVYGRTIKDARQMFLEFVGSSTPPADCDVQAVRDEYEQQISQLNATIASLETQITQLQESNTTLQNQINLSNDTIADLNQKLTAANATIASYDQQVIQLNATIGNQVQQITDLNGSINSLQQQITTMTSDHQAELESQAADLESQCQTRETTAYDNGYSDGTATCASTGPTGDPQLQATWDTGMDGYQPYALDVATGGVTYVLDQSQNTVIAYDNTGTATNNWTSSALIAPVDLAVDSSGSIFILDQYSATPVLKFTADGQQQTFDTSATPISYPLGMTIDSQDNIYVTDMGGTYGGRILKFSPSGSLLGTYGQVSDTGIAGEFYSDVAVDETTQSMYIVTLYSNMVAKFNADGTMAGSWTTASSNPNSIAIGAQGQVFVADTGNFEVDQYDASGNLTYTIQAPPLFRPTRIAVDNTGKLYVAGDSYQLVLIYQ